MEIPKNTTQIGEVHGNYKVFIEDYVISYMKQLCRQEPDRKKRIALYGVIRAEEPQQYFFIYGGREVVRYEKSDQHLTQQDYEEITWKGESYFDEYVPLGFVTIEEELPEGVYLFNAGKELYIQGYHIFYEKNESMLTFLIHRQNEKSEQKQDTEMVPVQEEKSNTPELAEQQNMLPQSGAGEARRLMREKKREEIPQGEVKIFGIVKSLAAALFIVLCVTAISTMNGLGKMESVQNYFQQAFQAMKEKKIPDREESVVTAAKSVNTDLMQQENEQSRNQQTSLEEFNEESTTVSENTIINEDVEIEEAVSEEVVTEETVAEEVVTEEIAVGEASVEAQEPTTHTIQAGETLISISKIYYGDESMVQTICELNGIANSDNIQVGQKIILP